MTIRPECPRCRASEAGTVPRADPLAFVCRYCQYVWDSAAPPATDPAPEPVVRDGAVLGHIHRKSDEPKPVRPKLATGEDLAETADRAASEHHANPAIIRLLLAAFDRGYRTGVKVTLANAQKTSRN